MRIEIIGDPVPKARPRVVRRGGKIRTYTPDESAAYAALVYVLARNNQMEMIPKGIPVRLKVECVMSQKKITSRPDLVNIVANIQDGLKGAGYYDDSQVVEIIEVKRKGRIPRAIIEVEAL